MTGAETWMGLTASYLANEQACTIHSFMLTHTGPSATYTLLPRHTHTPRPPPATIHQWLCNHTLHAFLYYHSL